MRIKSVIAGSLQVIWDSAAEEEGNDAVGNRIGLAFIVCKENEGVFHEILICKQRSEEGLRPACGILQGSVMPVVQHVWRQVRILWEGLSLDVLLEVVETLQLGKTRSIQTNAVVYYEGTGISYQQRVHGNIATPHLLV